MYLEDKITKGKGTRIQRARRSCTEIFDIKAEIPVDTGIVGIAIGHHQLTDIACLYEDLPLVISKLQTILITSKWHAWYAVIDEYIGIIGLNGQTIVNHTIPEIGDLQINIFPFLIHRLTSQVFNTNASKWIDFSKETIIELCGIEYLALQPEGHNIVASQETILPAGKTGKSNQ